MLRLAVGASVFLVGITTWFFTLGRSPMAGAEIGTLAEVIGLPGLRRSSERTASEAKAGTSVRLGDRLETGDADRAEIQFRDGTTLRLGFNTAIELAVPESDRRAPTSRLLRPAEIHLLRGQVWTRVQKMTNAPQYAIRTDLATAVARGTEFGVKLQRAGSALAIANTQTGNRGSQPAVLHAVLTVKEGTVDFFNSFGSVQATTMTESTARADSAPTEPTRLQTLQVVRLSQSIEWSILSSQLDWPDAAERLALGGGWAGFKVAILVNAATAASGIRIIQVSRDSPAAAAGLRLGDRLVAVDGQAVIEATQVSRLVLVRSNRVTALTVQREGGETMLELTPTPRPCILPGPGLSAAQAAALAEITRRWIELGVNSGDLAVAPRPDAILQAAAQNNLGVVLEAEDEVGPAIRAYGRAVQTASQVPLYRFNLGLALRKIGSFERAAEELATAVALAPDSVEALKRLAEVNALLGQDDLALAQTEAALAADPRDHGLWELQSRILSKLGRDAEATEAARAAVETGPGCAAALSDLGGALHRQGNLAEAEQAWRMALALAPFDALLHLNLGTVLSDQGERDSAVEHFRRAIELRPDFVPAYCGLAGVLGDQRQWAEAETALGQAAVLDSEDILVVRGFGQLFLGQGRLGEAEICYARALEASPHEAASYSGLGRVMVMQGNLLEAERLLRRARDLEPDSSDLHNNLGEVLRLRGNLDEAAQSYRRALELAPDSPSPYSNLGIIYAMRGEFAEAETMFRTLLDLASRNPRIDPLNFLVNLAMVCNRQGKLEEAEGIYRQALALRPDDPGIWNSLAWFLADHGINLDEAHSLARRAAQAAPNEPNFLDTLGWVLFRRGELDEAEVVLIHALECARGNPPAPDIREHLSVVQEKRRAIAQ
ncbi:MAG: tetratricopeptide repeat protein [Verrucomicrobia bacterium]|nr:tetratricopeptide repeat protein [Verrucomicrobiota bacterium]